MHGDTALMEFARLTMEPAPRINVVDGALLIAAMEYPALDRAASLRELDHLAEAAGRRVGAESGPYGAVNALSEFLFEEQGFRGNAESYYDPRNSFLNDVLGRRLGIPITLALIYIDLAERAGMTAYGVGLPGHFIVGVETHGERILIDPFHRGVILAEDDLGALMRASAGYDGPLLPEMLEPVDARAFLARMLNNLKTIYLNEQDYPRALATVERLALLYPGDAPHARLRDALRRALA